MSHTEPHGPAARVAAKLLTSASIDDASSDASPPVRSYEPFVAALIVVLLPIRELSLINSSSINLGVCLAALFSLLFLKALARYTGGRLVFVLFSLALASAPVLILNKSASRSLDASAERGSILFLIGGAVTFAALLWARSYLDDRIVVALFALGTIVNLLLSTGLWAEGAWKYGFSWPTSLVLLCLVAFFRSRVATMLVLVALAAITVNNDYRSFFASLCLVSVIYLWGSRRHAPAQLQWRAVALLALVCLLIYRATIWLSLAGLLGARNRTVTMQQVRVNGSLLDVGRAEWNATGPLFLSRPLGFGPGVQPSTGDLIVAKTGFVNASIDPNSAYISEYVLAHRLELHSVAADLWVSFGLAGLSLGFVMAALLLFGLRRSFEQARLSGLVVLLVVDGIWDLLFSPIGSNFLYVILAVAIVIPLSSEKRATSGAASAP